MFRRPSSQSRGPLSMSRRPSSQASKPRSRRSSQWSSSLQQLPRQPVSGPDDGGGLRPHAGDEATGSRHQPCGSASDDSARKTVQDRSWVKRLRSQNRDSFPAESSVTPKVETSGHGCRRSFWIASRLSPTYIKKDPAACCRQRCAFQVNFLLRFDG